MWQIAFKLSLTLATVERRPARLRDSSDSAAAFRPLAGLSFPTVNIKAVLKISKFSIGLTEILER
jgi:hypothetical protein